MATFKQKAKLWIWNSKNTWRAPPLLLLQIPIAILAYLFLFVAILVAAIAFLIGGFIGLFIPKVNAADVAAAFALFFGGLVAIVTLGPLLLVRSLLVLGVKGLFGLLGALIGLVTSPLALFFEPSQHWLKQEENSAIIAFQAQGFVAAQTSHPQGMLKVLKEQLEELGVDTSLLDRFFRTFSSVSGSIIPDPFLRFADFNPNVEDCIRNLGNEVEQKLNKEGNREVVKASNGQYYYRDQLDAAIQAKSVDTRITYDKSRDILPNRLLIKFDEAKRQCPVSGVELTADTAVRSIYGDYYSREGLQQSLALQRCPSTGHFLTMRFTSGVGERFHLEPEAGLDVGRVLDPAHSGSLGRFMLRAFFPASVVDSAPRSRSSSLESVSSHDHDQKGESSPHSSRQTH